MLVALDVTQEGDYLLGVRLCAGEHTISLPNVAQAAEPWAWTLPAQPLHLGVGRHWVVVPLPADPGWETIAIDQALLLDIHQAGVLLDVARNVPLRDVDTTGIAPTSGGRRKE
ncbi:MAG: hypothetical protein H5T69_15750 [Chloroflexi bacterium]|nr:hypothetical protein [Chloroflexota bacterium]